MKTAIYFLIFCAFIESANAQCKVITFEQGVSKHLITEDLFNTAINYNAFICPQFFQGDKTQCGTITDSQDKWDASLPDGLLFTAIFNPSEYALIRPVLQDPFFLDAITNVPDPSADALKWFQERNITNELVIPLEDDTIKAGSLDAIQKKMITVFYSIRSWTFCPETPTVDDDIQDAVFNPENFTITVYKTACTVDKVYDSDVSTSALAFKLFFVCSHEFGHAIDNASGKLKLVYITEAEYRANVIGLILTEAFTKLINVHLQSYQKIVHNFPNVLPCDITYMDRTVATWSKMDSYFNSRIVEAKISLKNNSGFAALSKTQKNWTVYACLHHTSGHK